MEVRAAAPGDAPGMSAVLRDIIEATGRERPADPAFVLSNYVANPFGIRCSVAVDDAGYVLGFQSLIRAAPGNPYDVLEGWGIIGTHISPRAQRRGVGTSLFMASRQAALQAGLAKIDACIQASNTTALRYYDALGFRSYRERGGVIQKAFTVERPAQDAGGL